LSSVSGDAQGHRPRQADLNPSTRPPPVTAGHDENEGAELSPETETGIVATNSDPSDSFPYPRGSVVGILTDEASFEDARHRLERAGFGADRCHVLHGEQGLARLDVEGHAHGKAGTIMRRLQTALSDDADHVRRYAEHLRAGHYVVGVAVGDDEAAKQRAADALRAARGEFLNYYADSYVEDLDADV
jgi:hypothetical protein